MFCQSTRCRPGIRSTSRPDSDLAVGEYDGQRATMLAGIDYGHQPCRFRQSGFLSLRGAQRHGNLDGSA